MSTVQEELLWIPLQCIVGGSVMDDSRHRFLVSDNDTIDSEDSIVSIEQPSTSQTTVMINEIIAFIRPRLKQNIVLYSELYSGPKMVKAYKIIRDLAKQMSSNYQRRNVKRVFKFKDVDISYLAPVPFDEIGCEDTVLPAMRVVFHTRSLCQRC